MHLNTNGLRHLGRPLLSRLWGLNLRDIEPIPFTLYITNVSSIEWSSFLKVGGGAGKGVGVTTSWVERRR